MIAALRVLSLAAGTALVLVTWSSVMRTLVVPRGLSSRLTATVERAVRWAFRRTARRCERLEKRDRVLAGQGPATLTALLFAWLMLFLAGFTLVLVGVAGRPPAPALRETGSSMFTLGFAASEGGGATAVAFLAAATGLLVVALQIAYLPTFYAAFNRREMLVTLLQSRAGVPAWGPELLARHQLVGIVDRLPDFYTDWERWSADVAESHSNYPVLVHFRSPHPLRSWVVALLAVLDSAALYLACCPASAPSEARLCLRMGFVSLREICRAIGVPFDDDPMPDGPVALSYDEFRAGVDRLREVGFPLERDADEAWPHFRGWRVNYEPLCYALAYVVDAVPAVWSGPREGGGSPIAPIRPPDRRPGER